MASIAELLVEQGRVRADYRRRRGERAGAIITEFGRIPAAIVADRDAARAAQAAAARQAAADARAQTQTDIAVSAENRALTAAERTAVAAEEAKAAEQRGREAVQAWLTQHAATIGPEAADRIAAVIQTPDGLKKAIEVLSQAPEPMRLIERDPTKDVIHPTTGAVITPGIAKPEKVTFSAPQPVMVNGRRTLVRAGSDGALYDMNQQKVVGATPDVPPTAADRDGEPLVAVMKDGKPILVRRSQAEGMTPATTREQGRQVTAGDAADLADLDSSLDDLNTLAKDMGTTGAESWFKSKIPDVITSWTGWGADAKSRQGTIDRVKQVIGKALEGGVLRKEDEIKYEKILPKLADAPSVAASKLQGLWRAIEKKKATRLDALADAGYDTERFRQRAPRQRETVQAPPAPAGWKYVPKPGGGWTAVEDK